MPAKKHYRTENRAFYGSRHVEVACDEKTANWKLTTKNLHLVTCPQCSAAVRETPDAAAVIQGVRQ